jgi:hypothetical protein
MPKTASGFIAYRERHETVPPLKPALASIWLQNQPT